MNGSFKTTAAVVAVASAVLLGGCSSSTSARGSASSPAGTSGPVAGATVSMWARSANADLEKAMVDAYNGSHSTKVALTIIPNDDYQTKVGTAAGSNSLPDILSSDDVYMPNYTSKNLFLDITGRVDALPFKGSLAPAHLKQSTVDGKVYAVPHTVDGSAMFYNKALFTKAGLDPATPPATYDDMVADAKKISALGNGIAGFYFGGNCGGCNAYDMPPSIWGSGGSIIDKTGKASTFDTPQVKDLLAAYAQMWKDGSTAPSAKGETGATLTNLFQSGKVGMVPLGSGFIGTLNKVAGLDYGVAPLPTKDGKNFSTFVGGDVIGISAGSKAADAAWDFISWTLSEQVQTNIVATAGYVPVRTDLANNKVTAASPKTLVVAKLIASGQIPYSLNYGPAFNDPNGPWLVMIRRAVLQNDVAGAVTAGQAAVSDILGRS